MCQNQNNTDVNEHYNFKMEQTQTKPNRAIDKLESFENGEQVLNLLSFQTNFNKFLLTIKSIIGASIVVHPDNETSIAFRGKPIIGTKRERFNTPQELSALLEMAGLTN